jgi:hypothetical protein
MVRERQTVLLGRANLLLERATLRSAAILGRNRLKSHFLTLRRKAFDVQLGLLEAFDMRVIENIGGCYFDMPNHAVGLAFETPALAAHPLQCFSERSMELRSAGGGACAHGILLLRMEVAPITANAMDSTHVSFAASEQSRIAWTNTSSIRSNSARGEDPDKCIAPPGGSTSTTPKLKPGPDRKLRKSKTTAGAAGLTKVQTHYSL